MYFQNPPTHAYCAQSSISCFLRSFCETGIFRLHRRLFPHCFQGARHKNHPNPEHIISAQAIITKAQMLALSPISFTFIPNIDEAVLIGIKMNARTVTVKIRLLVAWEMRVRDQAPNTHVKLRSCFLRVPSLRP